MVGFRVFHIPVISSTSSYGQFMKICWKHFLLGLFVYNFIFYFVLCWDVDCSLWSGVIMSAQCFQVVNVFMTLDNGCSKIVSHTTWNILSIQPISLRKDPQAVALAVLYLCFLALVTLDDIFQLSEQMHFSDAIEPISWWSSANVPWNIGKCLKKCVTATVQKWGTQERRSRQYGPSLLLDVKVMRRSRCVMREMEDSGHIQLGMDQFLLIPFLVGWTSIYQLFWCSPGVQGFDTLSVHQCSSLVFGTSLLHVWNWSPVFTPKMTQFCA